MMNKLILLFFLISNFIFAQDQEAIIHFNDGSSIEGFAKIDKKDKIFFKISKTDEPTEWTYDDVTGVTFLGFEYSIKFEYVRLDKYQKPKLLELVTDGNVKLFRHNYYLVGLLEINIFPYLEKYYNQKDNLYNPFRNYKNEKRDYYLKRDSEEFPTKIKDNYIKSTSIYFSDCEVLVRKIKKHEFSFEKIEEIVEYYNDICSD
jgi:hypothetical protein